MDDGKESLDWIEDQANRNYEFRLNVLEKLQQEAHITLSISLVAAGWLISHIIETYNPAVSAGGQHWTVLFPLVVTAIYLTLVGVYIMSRIVNPKGIRVPTNEPKNLVPLVAKYSSVQIRTYELKHLQQKIDETGERNKETAARLTRSRLFLCASPLVFLFFLALCVAGS